MWQIAESLACGCIENLEERERESERDHLCGVGACMRLGVYFFGCFPLFPLFRYFYKNESGRVILIRGLFENRLNVGCICARPQIRWRVFFLR